MVGLFPNAGSAERAIRDLKNAGFRAPVGVLMRDRDEERKPATETGTEAGEAATAGAYGRRSGRVSGCPGRNRSGGAWRGSPDCRRGACLDLGRSRDRRRRRADYLGRSSAWVSRRRRRAISRAGCRRVIFVTVEAAARAAGARARSAGGRGKVWTGGSSRD